MILHMVTIMKDRCEANQDKMKIGVGSFDIEKVREIGEKTREGEIRRMSKYLVGWSLRCKA